MLKTRKLLRECGYEKLIIDETNKMTLVQPDGRSFIIVDNDDHDFKDDDTIKGSDDDDDYIYNIDDYSEEESKEDIMDVDDEDKESEEEGEEENKKSKEKKEGAKEEEEDEDEDKDEEVDELESENKSEDIMDTKESEKKSEDIMDVDEEEEGEEEGEKEDEEENEEEEHLIPVYTINMGQDLHILLQNINKIPTPPPTNNDHYINKEKYREVLVNHLSTINSVDEFSNDTNHKDIFVPVYPSTRKSSLSFILNEEEEEEKEEESKDDDQEMRNIYHAIYEHQINIVPGDPVINRNVIAELNNSSYPSSLLKMSLEDFTNKKQMACTILTNIILRIYDLSLNDYISNEIIRRRNFRHLILFLDYYERLEVYCSLHKERKKGQTIKSQATKMIVKSSKPSREETPRIKSTAISTILNKASRVRRLLKIASNNLNIIDAFPDLDPYLFTAKKIGVVNFERWLELVRTNKLVSFEEGKQLYNDFKTELKRKRTENLNTIYNEAR